MLGMIHTLVIWSDDLRLGCNTHRYYNYLLLLCAIGAGWIALSYGGIVVQNSYVCLLSLLYAWRQHSPWPLTLLVFTLDIGPSLSAAVDYHLQTKHAELLSLLLLTSIDGSTVHWQGVAVHVGPSCINLLMFQAAASIGWLVTSHRTPLALMRNVGTFIAVTAVLNFFRILTLTLLAPLAPNEQVWLIVHDGVSLGASALLVAYIWWRLKWSTKNAIPPNAAQTISQ